MRHGRSDSDGENPIAKLGGTPYRDCIWPRESTTTIRALHLRGLNMLYEAIREKGAMVIVPSSAIETMGLGGTFATASIAKQQ